MSNLEIKSQKSEEITQIYKRKELLNQSVLIAIDRVNSQPLNVPDIVEDVLNEFDYLDIDIILKAIKSGSLGVYGRTYKMSTQEVCIWIREYVNLNGKGVLNPNNEEIVRFNSNVNPTVKKLLKSEFLQLQEKNKNGGYIYNIIKR